MRVLTQTIVRTGAILNCSSVIILGRRRVMLNIELRHDLGGSSFAKILRGAGRREDWIGLCNCSSYSLMTEADVLVHKRWVEEARASGTYTEMIDITSPMGATIESLLARLIEMAGALLYEPDHYTPCQTFTRHDLRPANGVESPCRHDHHGLICTRPADHAGPHANHNGRRDILAIWSEVLRYERGERMSR